MKFILSLFLIVSFNTNASRTGLGDVNVAILQEGTSYYYCPMGQGFEYLEVMMMDNDARAIWNKMTVPARRYTASIQEKVSKYVRCENFNNGQTYTCFWFLKQKTYVPMTTTDAKAAMFHQCTGATLFMLPSEGTDYDFNTNELTFRGGKISDYLFARGEPACSRVNGKVSCKFPAPKFID